MAINIDNRRARYEYQILDTFSAGIILTGTEIKSVREGQANLSDAYCVFQGNELWIKSLFIAEYTMANRFNHETRRLRKLLLTKRELKKLQSKVKERGLTIIPLKMYLSERGFAKIDIGLCKGKKTHDKRHSIKDRDIKRDIDRGGRY